MPHEALPVSTGGDYPLWLLRAVKEALFRVCEDPRIEDARHVLEAIDAAMNDNPPTSASQ